MNIVCLGGGPAGLYFALLMKLQDPTHVITVVERNRPFDTFGWGVVLSDQTLGNLRAADPVSAQLIGDAFNHWDDVEMFFKGRSVRSGGHGFCGIGRKKLLNILQERCIALRVDLVFGGYCLVVLQVGFKHQIDAELNAALLQDVEQALSAYAAKAVAARAHTAALEKNLNVIPVVEGIANQLRANRVGYPKVAQRLVRQHNAPAKGVKRAVAFHHGDGVGRVLQLHQHGKVQTGGAAAQANNAH